jgi:hypothetical protein
LIYYATSLSLLLSTVANLATPLLSETDQNIKSIVGCGIGFVDYVATGRGSTLTLQLMRKFTPNVEAFKVGLETRLQEMIDAIIMVVDMSRASNEVVSEALVFEIERGDMEPPDNMLGLN